ncbi:MAG: DUF4864 domain-containing protein [Acidobacteria bacterium]|nr:DUF4864 domain-containing protein [Acidobacteriota bacterium]
MQWIRLHGLIAGLLLALAAVAADQPAPVEPAPDLEPRDVVEAQLAAFRHNDDPEPDAGIRIAFGFASPANRQMTGPIDRFIAMIKQPGYDILLHHQRSSLSDTTKKGDQARIKVHLIDAKGAESAFVWILSRQIEKPYEGCWMTDSVFRVDVGKSPFQVAWSRP